MREIAFIKQNKAKWLDFEQSLKQRGNRNPDELAQAYIQLLNDLSYAQTYYPKSKTTVYLNFLVSQIYRKIYRTRRVEQNKLTFFFKTEVPTIVYENRRMMWFAFALFFFFTTMGVLSARYDNTFVRLVLGDHYVNMTLNNIDKGDPMAVYKSQESLGSFVGITINNVMVAAKAYIYGLSAGILTFYIALSNGIMLGSFQYFFYQHGVFGASLRGIWLHGAMEIFSIVISTAAGFILASSFLFPQTYSRICSFKLGVQQSLKVFLSTLPFFVSAGFIEGFVTRYSNTMPLWLNLLIILVTLTLISFYYLIYPLIVNKKQNHGNIPTL
jgi:uncharacterized membrane protein SpoIIM required for sporulation